MARESVDRTVENTVSIVNSFRRQRCFINDRFTQSIESRGALEFIQDHLAVLWQHLLPIMTGSQVWRVNQNVERFAAARCDVGFCYRGSTDIRRWVRGRLSAVVNVVEFFFRITRKDKVVMQQLFVAAIQTQIKHDTTACRFVPARFVEGFGLRPCR